MEKSNNPFFAELVKIAGLETEAGYEGVVPEEEEEEVLPEEQELPPELAQQMQGEEQQVPPELMEQAPEEQALPPELAGQAPEQQMAPEQAMAPEEQMAPEGELVEEQPMPEGQPTDPNLVDPAMMQGEEGAVEAPPETPDQIESAIDSAAAEASDEAEAAIAGAKALPGQVNPNISTQLEGPVTAEQMEQMEQVAASLPEYAAFAKVASIAFLEEVDEETQKTASSMFDTALESLEGYMAVTEKVAAEMFDSEEAKQALYSVDSMERVANVLEYITSSEGFDKHAEEGDSFANKAKGAVETFRNGLTDLVDKAKYNLINIKGDIDEGRIHLAELDNEVAKASQNFATDRNNLTGAGDAFMDLRAQRQALGNQVDQMVRTRNMALGGAVAGVGAAAAGAYAGGRAIHNHFADNQPDDTLVEEQPNSINGGVQKMSQQKQYVNDMLKLAAVAGLIKIQENGFSQEASQDDVEFAKEAGARFEQIAALNPAYIGDELVKLAYEIYGEDELKEVVAGVHNEEIFEKTAETVSWGYANDEQLEKIAGAGSVSARGVGDALRNAKEQVENIIGQVKTKTESGQERFGEKGSEGLKNIGKLDGYSVINNPSRYEVSKTASESFEEAMMVKQAAAQANMEADAFLHSLAEQGHVRLRD